MLSFPSNMRRQYFNEHLNGAELDGDGVRTDLGKPEADDTVPAPDLEEIQQEIKKLKNNRTAGKVAS